MKYIDRELERKFLSMNGVFKAVMIVGARQVGKSTMLRRLAEKEGRQWVTMDEGSRQKRSQAVLPDLQTADPDRRGAEGS